jgi:hypothetical protein
LFLSFVLVSYRFFFVLVANYLNTEKFYFLGWSLLEAKRAPSARVFCWLASARQARAYSAGWPAREARGRSSPVGQHDPGMAQFP